MRIGLIGNGAIAECVAEYCATEGIYTIVGAIVLPNEIKSSATHRLITSWDELRKLNPEVIVECAGHEAVKAYAEKAMDADIDLIVASTGSLADANFYAEIKAAAERSTAQIKLPAGALPGIDAVAAARLGGLASVSLRSAKPPSAWTGTPAELTGDLSRIETAVEIFSGNARDAALTYPKNANVAATVALAGVGFEETVVTLVADPRLSHNTHRIEAEGTFGRLTLEIHAHPSPDNPKTSRMAALSILRALQNERAAIVI